MISKKIASAVGLGATAIGAAGGTMTSANLFNLMNNENKEEAQQHFQQISSVKKFAAAENIVKRMLEVLPNEGKVETIKTLKKIVSSSSLTEKDIIYFLTNKNLEELAKVVEKLEYNEHEKLAEVIRTLSNNTRENIANDLRFKILAELIEKLSKNKNGLEKLEFFINHVGVNSFLTRLELMKNKSISEKIEDLIVNQKTGNDYNDPEKLEKVGIKEAELKNFKHIVETLSITNGFEKLVNHIKTIPPKEFVRLVNIWTNDKTLKSVTENVIKKTTDLETLELKESVLKEVTNIINNLSSENNGLESLAKFFESIGKPENENWNTFISALKNNNPKEAIKSINTIWLLSRALNSKILYLLKNWVGKAKENNISAVTLIKGLIEKTKIKIVENNEEKELKFKDTDYFRRLFTTNNNKAVENYLAGVYTEKMVKNDKIYEKIIKGKKISKDDLEVLVKEDNDLNKKLKEQGITKNDLTNNSEKFKNFMKSYLKTKEEVITNDFYSKACIGRTIVLKELGYKTAK